MRDNFFQLLYSLKCLRVADAGVCENFAYTFFSKDQTIFAETWCS